MCSGFSVFVINRVQRKVLKVILVIMVVPMLIASLVSAAWIANHMSVSIEHWIREAAQVNQNWLESLQASAVTFVDLYEEIADNCTEMKLNRTLISDKMTNIAGKLGLNLIQIYDMQGRLRYSSQPVTMELPPAAGKSMAVVRAKHDETELLAAVRLEPFPRQETACFQLVVGTLFDKSALLRLNRMSGLRTRIFYPEMGTFTKAFSTDRPALRLRLPAEAFADLMNRQEYYSERAEDGRFWGLYTPVVDGNGKVEAVIFTGLEHRGENLLLDRVTLTLTITLMGTLLALVTGLLLSRVLVRPVAYLRDAVMQVAAQDFRATVPIHSDDEIGDLARTFNAMALSLKEARDEQLRTFQHDKITALGELSMALAHEIRNPIGVIRTASGLLETTTDPERQRLLRSMIRDETRTMDRLLQDFQQLARYRQPEFALIDPLQPLEKALRVVLAGRDNITLTRVVPAEQLWVRADADLLHQVWVNLLNNALEAMGEQAGEIKVEVCLEGGKVEIYLQDSGPGLALEQIPRLFEPFYTTKPQGSGLGLTIASELVQANGGWLSLAPDIGPGTCFVMRLPKADEVL
ncbi:MAG: HAMP domain-containing histidine kinase [Magnetococcales bacterium]|nr:HAMP domain-containing histidine kinase [Magnetococcales bacterium]